MKTSRLIKILIATVIISGIGGAIYTYREHFTIENFNKLLSKTKNIILEVKPQKDDDKEIKIDSPIRQEIEEKYKEAVSEYYNKYKEFFYNEDEEIRYNGYAEYGYILDKMIENKEYKVISYNGVMADGYGEDDRGSRQFILDYLFNVVDEQPAVIEKIENFDYTKDRSDVLNSIIPNFIILKGDLIEGNSWDQSFVYKEKEYIAKTTIKDLNANSFTIETIVEGMEDFPNKTYKEERTYEKGVGLLSFSNTPINDGEYPEDQYIFGYSTSSKMNE